MSTSGTSANPIVTDACSVTVAWGFARCAAHCPGHKLNEETLEACYRGNVKDLASFRSGVELGASMTPALLLRGLERLFYGQPSTYGPAYRAIEAAAQRARFTETTGVDPVSIFDPAARRIQKRVRTLALTAVISLLATVDEAGAVETRPRSE